MRAWAALGLAALLAGPGASAAVAAPRTAVAPLQGLVTQVSDGDTLRFTTPGQPPIAVRLARIDAPEICQPWGPQSRAALSGLVLNKPATLRPTGRDAEGRLLGLLVVDGVDAAAWLVQEGHAWSLRTRNGRGPLMKEERLAQALNRGLHAGGQAQSPADFRRTHGPCATDAAR